MYGSNPSFNFVFDVALKYLKYMATVLVNSEITYSKIKITSKINKILFLF